MWLLIHALVSVNTLRLRQNGQYFTDNTFKCVFLDENIWIVITEPMMVSSLMHICVTRHQWFNPNKQRSPMSFRSLNCMSSRKTKPVVTVTLTHHGPVPHICVTIFSAYFRTAPDMWRWFQCSFPQCPIHGAWQTARSSPVPQIVVARPHLLSHQRPIYVARHGPLSLHVLCVKY